MSSGRSCSTTCDTRMVLISIDEDLDGLRAVVEKLTSRVRWITVSPAAFAEIVGTLRAMELRDYIDKGATDDR